MMKPRCPLSAATRSPTTRSRRRKTSCVRSTAAAVSPSHPAPIHDTKAMMPAMSSEIASPTQTRARTCTDHAGIVPIGPVKADGSAPVAFVQIGLLVLAAQLVDHIGQPFVEPPGLAGLAARGDVSADE